MFGAVLILAGVVGCVWGWRVQGDGTSEDIVGGIVIVAGALVVFGGAVAIVRALYG